MKIAVVGTGYVGLVVGACLAENGNQVVCVDKDAAKARALQRGKIPIYEPGLEEYVKRNRTEKRLDLVVTLQDWDDLQEVDRIGLDQEFYEVLKLQVPHLTIPVRPGRDIARVIEVAAMDPKLKSLGRNSAVEFNDKLLNLMGTPTS